MHRKAPAADTVNLVLPEVGAKLTSVVFFDEHPNETAKVDIERIPVGDFMTANQAAKFVDRLGELAAKAVFEGKAYDYSDGKAKHFDTLTVILSNGGDIRFQAAMRDPSTGDTATVALSDVEVPAGVTEQQALKFIDNLAKAARKKLLSGQVLT